MKILYELVREVFKASGDPLTTHFVCWAIALHEHGFRGSGPATQTIVYLVFFFFFFITIYNSNYR